LRGPPSRRYLTPILSSRSHSRSASRRWTGLSSRRASSRPSPPSPSSYGYRSSVSSPSTPRPYDCDRYMDPPSLSGCGSLLGRGVLGAKVQCSCSRRCAQKVRAGRKEAATYREQLLLATEYCTVRIFPPCCPFFWLGCGPRLSVEWFALCAYLRSHRKLIRRAAGFRWRGPSSSLR